MTVSVSHYPFQDGRKKTAVMQTESSFDWQFFYAALLEFQLRFAILRDLIIY